MKRKLFAVLTAGIMAASLLAPMTAFAEEAVEEEE